jgi:conjugative transfer signal peptidase TraF
VTRATLASTVTAVVLLATSLVTGRVPLVYWNASESVQPGIYALQRGPPQIGDMVVVRLPPDIAAFAARRGYLPRNVLLIKPVRAIAGDVVCRFGGGVYVQRKLFVSARRADHLGRPLPRWHGCRALQSNEVFVVSEHPDGFDSRYFGPIPLRHVIGRARLLWPLAGKIKVRSRETQKS